MLASVYVGHVPFTFHVTFMSTPPSSMPQDFQHISVLYKQLVISLKFHHGQTLAQLPRDIALQAMNEVWDSCNVKPATNAHRRNS
jgi:hypothetical protein